MKLSRIDSEPPQESAPEDRDGRVEYLEDYSVRVRCYPDPSEGNKEFWVTLRDITGADLSAIGKWRKSGENEVDMNSRLLTRLCTDWNGRPGVALKELEKVRGKNLILLAEVTASFLG